MAPLSLSQIKNLIDEQTSTFLEKIKVLHDEIAALKTELATVHQCTCSCSLASTSSAKSVNAGDNVNKTSFADVVRQSVQSVLEDERARNDIVISKMDEQGDDEKCLADVCQKMNCESKPAGIRRLGKKTEGRVRLLQVSFNSSFDARTFRASYNNRQKSHKDLPNWRLRNHRTRDEQATFERNSKAAFQLNTAAKEAKLNESYSLRDDGTVWKYVKRGDKWKREMDWKLPPTELNASSGSSQEGNEQCTPKHRPSHQKSSS